MRWAGCPSDTLAPAQICSQPRPGRGLPRPCPHARVSRAVHPRAGGLRTRLEARPEPPLRTPRPRGSPVLPAGFPAPAPLTSPAGWEFASAHLRDSASPAFAASPTAPWGPGSSSLCRESGVFLRQLRLRRRCRLSQRRGPGGRGRTPQFRLHSGSFHESTLPRCCSPSVNSQSPGLFVCTRPSSCALVSRGKGAGLCSRRGGSRRCNNRLCST